MRRRRLVAGLLVACSASALLVSSSAVASWRRADAEVKELALEDRLESFRTGIKKFVLHRKELPQSLADLRDAGYGTRQPDPITGKDDWQIQIGEDPTLISGKRGIINIHSSSTAISSRGTAYNTW